MARSSHLSPEELATYVDGRAPRSEWKRMIGHLATCDACFRELVTVVRMVREQPDKPSERF
jgi:anti-sigma factor RsiW